MVLYYLAKANAASSLDPSTKVDGNEQKFYEGYAESLISNVIVAISKPFNHPRNEHETPSNAFETVTNAI